MVQHLSAETPTTDAPDFDRDALGEVLREAEGLVEALRAAQTEVGWLSPDLLRLVAVSRQVPLARVHGVASFYAGFHLEPRGKHVLRVCKGTACHVGGADRLVDALGKHLGIELGETTEDLSFTLESAACLGCCSLAPVLAAGEKTWGRIDGSAAVEVAAALNGSGS